jgi:hypothetical protein
MENDTQLEASFRLSESLLLFGSMVCAATYGVALTLYCICTRALLRRLRKPGIQRRTTYITLIYTTFAMACVTAYLGINHFFLQVSYIFHRDDFSGAPIIYYAFMLATDPVMVACTLLFAILDWLTLGVQVNLFLNDFY